MTSMRAVMRDIETSGFGASMTQAVSGLSAIENVQSGIMSTEKAIEKTEQMINQTSSAAQQAIESMSNIDKSVSNIAETKTAVEEMNQKLQQTSTATQAAISGIVNVESAVSGIIQELQGIHTATQKVVDSLDNFDKSVSSVVETKTAVEEMNQSLVNVSQSSQETIGAISGVESALQRESAAAHGASSAVMSIENAIQKANAAMSIAALNSENYKSKLEQIVEAMDKNEAAIIKLEKQQEKAFSDKRQTEIEKLIAKQDKLNESYAKTEIALMKSNNIYGQQGSKIEQLNRKLSELENKNKRINKQGDSMSSPFDKWAIRITGINSALRLTRRMLNTISKGFNTVLNATDKWGASTDGTATVMNKFNESIEKTQKSIGEKLLPLAAIGSDLAAQAFDWIGQKANEAIGWILDNIALVSNAIAIVIGFALIAATVFAIANAPALALIGVIILIATALTELGVTADQVLGFIGGTIGGLYATFYSIIAGIWNFIADFINFFGNSFNDLGSSLEILFYDVAQTVIGFILQMATAVEDLINKIPGMSVDLTSTMTRIYSTYSKAAEKAKSEADWVEYVAKADYMDVSASITAGVTFGAGIGDKLTGIEAALAGFDLSKYSTPDKTLKTSVQNEVTISDEDIKMLLDISTRGFFDVTYQNLTPQISINIDTIREAADVDDLADKLAYMIEDAKASSLYHT